MKRFISLCMTAFIILGMLQINVMASAGEINIISPAAEVYSDLEKFEVECSDAEKIIFELDGVKIGETDGETSLALSDGTLSVGNHTLKVSAIFPNKTAAQKEMNFNVTKMVTVQKYEQNFTKYGKGDETIPSGLTLTTNGNGAFSADVGATSAADDYSMKLCYTTNPALTSGKNPKFEVNDFTNFGKGIATFKFDFKTNDTKARVALLSMPLTEANKYIIYGGAIPKTSDGALNIGKWDAIEMKIDYGANRLIVKLNNKIVYDGEPVPFKSYSTSSSVNYTLMQVGARTDATRTAMWIDNMYFTQELAYGLDTILYGNDSSWTSCGSSLIPADTPMLKLVLTQALDPATVSKDKVSIFQNGAELSVSDVVYNEEDNSIVVTPLNAFDKGSEIIVKLADSVKVSGVAETVGTSLEARVNTELPKLTPSYVSFKKNDSPLVNGAQLETGDSVSVDLTLNNDTSESKKMAAIVSVIQNGKMRSVGAVEYTLDAGTTKPVTVSLPPLATLDDSGDISVKLIICDGLGSTSPYMAYTEVK